MSHGEQSVFKCTFSYLSAVWCWYHWTMLSMCFCVCESPELYSCRNPGPSLSRRESTADTPLPPFPQTDETLAGGSGGCSSRTASFSLCPSSQSEAERARAQEERGMERREEVREWEQPEERRTNEGWGRCRSSSSEIPGRRVSSCLSLLPWQQARGSRSHSGRDIPLLTRHKQYRWYGMYSCHFYFFLKIWLLFCIHISHTLLNMRSFFGYLCFLYCVLLISHVMPVLFYDRIKSNHKRNHKTSSFPNTRTLAECYDLVACVTPPCFFKLVIN